MSRIASRHLRIVLIFVGVVAPIVGWQLYGATDDDAKNSAAIWQRQASPGDLSTAHASLTNDCAACHTAVKGPEDAKCIACHGNDTALLQRQPTSFHANIGSCAQCHIEHQGESGNLRRMDHAQLARIGLKLLERTSEDSDKEVRAQLLHWIEQHPTPTSSTPSHPRISALEMALNCQGCHATKDRHQGLFGQECAQCHTATQWTIADFQHPSPGSFDCAQCHQAPPSHYMTHFSMVSKRVARQEDERVAQCCGAAQVNQCYRCHQTTSWNDIKGVGFYKHH